MALGFLYRLGGMILFGLSALFVRDHSDAPVALANPNFQPAEASADETPIYSPPPVPVEKEIEHAVEEFRNAEPPDNDRPLGQANIQNPAQTHNLERAIFFIVIFLLTMLVVYALLIRKSAPGYSQ